MVLTTESVQELDEEDDKRKVIKKVNQIKVARRESVDANSYNHVSQGLRLKRERISKHMHALSEVPDFHVKGNIFVQSSMLLTLKEFNSTQYMPVDSLKKHLKFLETLKGSTDKAIKIKNKEDIKCQEDEHPREKRKEISKEIKKLSRNILTTQADINIISKTINDFSNYQDHSDDDNKEITCYDIIPFEKKERRRTKKNLSIKTNYKQDTLVSVISPLTKTNFNPLNTESGRPSTLPSITPSQLGFSPIKKIGKVEVKKRDSDIRKSIDQLNKSKKINVQQMQHLEKIYNNINLSKLESLKEKDITDYFKIYHEMNKKVLFNYKNITPSGMLQTIDKFKSKLDHFNFNHFNKSYLNHTMSRRILQNTEKVMYYNLKVES
jgi:hypothetical protein